MIKYLFPVFFFLVLLVPSTVSASRLWSAGCELQGDAGGNATSLMEFQVSGTDAGSTQISTSIKRSGLSSCRSVRATDGTATWLPTFNDNSTAIATPVYFRMYVYIDTAPTDRTGLAYFWDQGVDSAVGGIDLTSAGELVWVDTNGLSLATSTTLLATDTWHRIELAYDAAASWEVKINGERELFQGSNTGGNTDSIKFGLCFSGCEVGGAGGQGDIYFDDLAVNNTDGTAQNFYPGEGRLVHMQPDSAGDTNNCSTGDVTSVDEITPDDSTSACVLDDNSEILDVNVETSLSAGIDSYDRITLVHVGTREAAASAAADGWATRVKSAAAQTVQTGTTKVHNDATYRTNGDTGQTGDPVAVPSLTSYTDPSTGAIWKPTGTNSLDNMQIGIICTDATPDCLVSTLWALVEYVDMPTSQPLTSFSFCREMTMATGGGSGGAATSTTLGMPLFASTTLSTLAGTTSGGNIQSVSLRTLTIPEHPRDFIVTSDGDCDFATGSTLDFYTESYSSTTGAIAFWLESLDISSTTPKDVNIYYGQATSTEFQNTFGVWDGVSDAAGVYNLNEWRLGAFSPDVLDASLAARNASTTGGMTNSDQVGLQVNGALDFDSGDAASVGDLAAYDSATQLSMCTWVNSNLQTSNDPIAEKSNGAGGGWTFHREDVGDLTGNTEIYQVRVEDTTGTEFMTVESATNSGIAGETKNVCFTLQIGAASELNLYIDGALAAGPTTTPIDGISSGSSALVIGAASALNSFFDGRIDNVITYFSVLDPMDILTYYNNTKSSAVFWTFGAEQTQAVASTVSFPRAILNGVKFLFQAIFP